MAQKSPVLTVLLKRLLPLYVSAFFQGFVLWYAIEKLFMHHIGFTDAGIGVMVAAYSVIMLLVETPSGILADRWSRKGVLMLASISLAISSFLGGVSTEPVLYIVSALFWGIFYALYSGTYDSIIYDTIIEETGKSDAYERYYGRITFIESAAYVCGALLGGVIGQWFGLPATYFFSVPVALLSLIALWFFKEPQLHKAEKLGSIKEHVLMTFHSVVGKRLLVRLLVLLILVTLAHELLYEFSQLWFIALTVPPVFFGPGFAFVLSALGFGGLLAGVVGKHRWIAVLLSFLSLGVSSVGLIFIHSFIAIVALQVLLGISSTVLSILFMRDLHDELPSHVRAGASSAVSTMSRIVLIPLALFFGFVSSHVSIFVAEWIVVGLVTVAIICASLPQLKKKI